MKEVVAFIARALVCLCLVWIVVWPSLGGGHWGKDIFASWGSNSFLHDSKAAVPILMVTFPILIGGSIAALFAETVSTARQQDMSMSSTSVPCGRMGNFCNVVLCKIGSYRSPHWVGLVGLIFLPCLLYVTSSMVRKLSDPDLSTNDAIKEAANVFGLVATVVLSWLLVPVTREGPIGRLLAWDPVVIAQYHIWSGRIVVVGSLIHGGLHTLRFALQGTEVFTSYIFPPLNCWKDPHNYQPPICEEADGGECSCYHHFVPFTGLVAAIGILLIGLTSLYRVRRKTFAYFATVHYILTPLSLVAICIHYNKSILYASGSILYYLASNYPGWIESWLRRARKQPIKVISVRTLKADPSQPLRCCVVMTIEASESAARQHRPGVHGRLHVPSISRVAHPFTINRVPDKARQIRTIFRVNGPFTRALGKALRLAEGESTAASPKEKGEGCKILSTESPSSIPSMFLAGYYGSGRLLLHIARQDVCVIVAAGIGITPYLSLFAELSNLHDMNHSDGLISPEWNVQPKTIILHWICRDESLVNYCQEEYFDPYLRSKSIASTTDSNVVSVKIFVHRTGGGQSTFSDLEARAITAAGEVLEQNRFTPGPNTNPLHSNQSEPFDVSQFQAGQDYMTNIGCLAVFATLGWGGLRLLWAGYQRQGTNSMIERLYTVAIVLAYGLVVALVANSIVLLQSMRRHSGWTPLDRSEWEGLESGLGTDVVEMATVKDPTEYAIESPSRLHMEDQLNRRKVMTSIMSQGRPRIADIIQHLQDGVRPALFCCVPKTLEKELRNAIRPACGVPTVSFYAESFEL
jgi:predicted ferric reductase